MNFNLVLRPLRRLQDAILCSGLLGVFPASIKDRVQHVTNIMNSNRSDKYTSQEIGQVVDKMETVLPMYGDIPTDISEEYTKELVINYLEENKLKHVSYKNLFPPVEYCCNKKLVWSPCCKCIVFERLDAVAGQVYNGFCTECSSTYSLNSYKRGDSDVYYEDVLDHKYFASSRETVFEKDFLYSIDRDM